MLIESFFELDSEPGDKPAGVVGTKRLVALVSSEILKARNLLCTQDMLTKEHLGNIIERRYGKKQPLVFNITFGCYKRPHLPSHTFANWAEVINISFMLRILSRIAKLYEYGCILRYRMQDICLEELNGITKKDVINYSSSFEEIINIFRTRVPSGISIVIEKYSEIFPEEKFANDIIETIPEIDAEWNKPENIHIIEESVKRAERNQWRTDKTYEELLYSAKYHGAYTKIAVKYESQGPSDEIMLVHRKTLKGNHFLHYRCCETSCVQFWVGEGCLIKRPGKTFPTILSLQQLAKHNKILEIENKTFSTTNPNLKSLPIYEERK